MHCRPLTEMIYAAKLLTWGFAMEGKVKPVGTLVRPLAASAHPASPAAPRPATPPAPAAIHHVARVTKASGFPAIPVAAGGALVAVLVAAGIVLTVRRQRRGENPPGP